MSILKSLNSFNNLEIWLNECKHLVLNNCVFVLCGTKFDLERKVEYSNSIDFMKANNLDIFLETSSKSGENIKKIFEYTSLEWIKKTIKINKYSSTLKKENFKFNYDDNKKNKKNSKCC